MLGKNFNGHHFEILSYFSHFLLFQENRLWQKFSADVILKYISQGPVVQSIVSSTSSLRVISLTVLADSMHSILIFFAEKM